MMIFLDRQHLGKPNRWNDEGAAKAGMTETYLTSQYIFHAENHLRFKGFDVCVLSDGWYKDRHRRVNDYCANVNGKCVYVACHINAGGGSYAASFYDHRSASGKSLAHSINVRLLNACPELQTAKAIESKPDDWTKNAYYTIKGIGKPVSICFEPLFIDCLAHEPLTLPDGIKRVGIALAEGIQYYLENN